MVEGKKKEGLLKRLGQDLKLQVGFCVICMLVLFIAYAFSSQWLEKNVIEKKIQTYPLVFDRMVLAQIEECSIDRNTIELSGGVVQFGANLINVRLILRDTGTMEEKIYKTSYCSSEYVSDTKKYYGIENLNGHNGFRTKIPQSDVSNNACYEIDLHITFKTQVDNGNVGTREEKKIVTNYFLYNNEIYQYNPLLFEEPLFSEGIMKNVIKDGKVCGYDTENGAWVYHYENSFYFILDEQYEVNKQKKIRMFVHLYSNSVHNLPEEHRNNGFENKDFYFDEYECEAESNSAYRVARIILNEKYPISYMHAGYYDEQNNKNHWEMWLGKHLY